jgi:uncharacterized protein (TIGR02145 family)
MKEAGITHWSSPNTGATNTSGFRGLPGGDREVDGSFIDLTRYSTWWASIPKDAYDVYTRLVSSANDNCPDVYEAKSFGFSARCLKDN